MPQHEGSPIAAAEQTAQEAVFHQDGSLNETFLSERFGVGAEEAMQQVTFGSYTGTVAQMLSDERCPVGGMVSTAYKEKGLEGVAEKFKTLGEMDPRFSVEITEATVQRELVKKKDIAPDSEVTLKEPRLTDNTQASNMSEQSKHEEAVLRGTVLSKRQSIELLKQTAIPAEAAENTVLLSSSEPEVVERPSLLEIKEVLERELTAVPIDDLAESKPAVSTTKSISIDVTKSKPAVKTVEPKAESAIPDTVEVVSDERTYILEELQQIMNSDDLPIVTYLQSIEDHIPGVDETEVYMDINGEVLVDVGEATSLPFKRNDEQLHTAQGLIIEVFDISPESFEPEELVEIDEILENLLAEIQLNIDDLKLDVEDLLANETLIEICSELQEKLGIDLDEKAMRLFIELLVQEYRLQETKPEDMTDIDFLNRMGTWEYKISEGKSTKARLDLREQATIILRLGGISILRAA